MRYSETLNQLIVHSLEVLVSDLRRVLHNEFNIIVWQMSLPLFPNRPKVKSQPSTGRFRTTTTSTPEPTPRRSSCGTITTSRTWRSHANLFHSTSPACSTARWNSPRTPPRWTASTCPVRSRWTRRSCWPRATSACSRRPPTSGRTGSSTVSTSELRTSLRSWQILPRRMKSTRLRRWSWFRTISFRNRRRRPQLQQLLLQLQPPPPLLQQLQRRQQLPQRLRLKVGSFLKNIHRWLVDWLWRIKATVWIGTSVFWKLECFKIGNRYA